MTPRRACRKVLCSGIALLVLMLVPPMGEADTSAREPRDKGAELYREGQFGEAIPLLETATERWPGSLETWQLLGWAYRKDGNAPAATRIWERILKIDPARTELWNAIAAVHMEREAWSEAVTYLDGSLSRDPGQDHIRLRLATSFERAGRPEKARQNLEELVQRNPKDVAAAIRLYGFFDRNEDEAAARDVLRAAMERLPDEAHVLAPRMARLEARRGRRAYARGDFEDAVSAYLAAVRSDPLQHRYFVDLGWALRKSGRLSDAILAWKTAREAAPEDPELMRILGDALWERGRRDLAAREYRALWKLLPDGDDVAAFRLATVALAEQRPEETFEWLAKMLRKPGAATAWLESMGSLFLRFEQPAEGIAFFLENPIPDQQGEPDAILSRLYGQLGKLARGVSDSKSAVRHYRQALQWNPANRQALRELGWTFWSLEDWKSCQTTWERFSRLDPTDVVPYNLLTQMHLHLRSFDAAVATARASLALEEDQPKATLQLGRALFWSGHRREGMALAESIAAKNPDDVEVQRFWGELLTQNQDFSRALAQWEHVIELGGADERARFARLQSMYELGDYAPAVEEARRLASTTGLSEEGLRLLVRDATLLGNLVEAVRWQERLVDVAPERPEFWVELARLQLRRDDLEGVRRTLARARAIHSGVLEIEMLDAALLRREGRDADADAAYRSLVESYPEDHDIFLALLRTVSRQGRYREALELLDQTRALRPYEVALERARVYYALGESAKALAILTRVARADGRSFVPVLSYRNFGRHERASGLPIAQFESQIAALRDAGYTVVTSEELSQIGSSERPVPERPIVILFDDTLSASVQLADAVLDRYGLKATRFTSSESATASIEESFDCGLPAQANGPESESSRPILLPRLAVPRGWNGEDLLRHLALEYPRARAMSERARIEIWTGRYERARETWAEVVEEYPSLKDTASYYLASIALHQLQFERADRYLTEAERAGGSRPEDVAQLRRRLSWLSSTRATPRLTLFGDSAARSQRSRSLRVSTGALFELPAEVDVGTVLFGEAELTPIEATELAIGVRGQEATPLRWNVRGRGRDGHGSAPDSVNAWTSLGWESDNNELWLRLAREDVDTLRARRRAIAANTVHVTGARRIGASSTLRLDGQFGRLTDGNRLSSVSVKTTFLPFGREDFLLGAVGGWTDSEFQSPAYYTPDELTWGRGLVGYRNAGTDWRFDGTFELGWGRDALRGDRLTIHARGNAEQIWSSRVRSSLELSYSRSPSYQSWGAALAVHVGLTDMR